MSSQFSSCGLHQFTKYFSLLKLFNDEHFTLSSDVQADHKNFRKTKEIYHYEINPLPANVENMVSS
jgi:hypothetical protein